MSSHESASWSVSRMYRSARYRLFRSTSCKFKKNFLWNTKQEVKNMENYRKSAHCTYDIKYHIVWITKYRKPVITGKIAERTREIIRIVCKTNEVEILTGHLRKDHIHLLVSVPPRLSVSKIVQYMKVVTSRKLQMDSEFHITCKCYFYLIFIICINITY
jgi:REP element-mobilizing transposase RayT